MKSKAIFRFVVAFVPILIISIVWSNKQLSDQTNRIVEIENSQLQNKLQLLGNYYSPIVDGVHFWSSLTIDSMNFDSAFTQRIIHYIEGSQTFDQFRILDLNGHETFRINKQSNGDVELVSTLQDKSDRYYFKESESLAHNEVYISPIDLNKEWGEIEIPHKHVFRCVSPLYNSKSNKVGYVVINFKAHKIFSILNTNSKFSHISIVDNFENIITAPEDSILSQADQVELSQSTSDYFKAIHQKSKLKDSIIFDQNEVWINKHISLANHLNIENSNTGIQIKSPVELTFMSLIPESSFIKFRKPILNGRFVFLAFCFTLILTLSIVYTKREESKRKHILELIETNKKLENAKERLLIKRNELEKLNHSLTIKNGQLQEFNYLISHNLKAPITSITTLSDLMNQTESIEEYKLLANKLNTVAFRIANLITDLLQYVRILNTNKVELKKLNLETIITESAELFVESLNNNDFKIIKELNEWTEIEFNEVFLRSVVQNLVSNAIKYKSTDRESYIKFKTLKRESKLILEVSDNGIGIDLEKHKDEIFKLYKRFHREYSGKGLGLFLVKSQLESLNATITVESEVDKGTIFKLTFNI